MEDSTLITSTSLINAKSSASSSSSSQQKISTEQIEISTTDNTNEITVSNAADKTDDTSLANGAATIDNSTNIVESDTVVQIQSSHL